jgi:separase
MFTKDYINVCIELALEYMKLGKTKRATALFNHTLTAVKSGKASEDVCVMFYLRHAESLALAEDISKRYNQRSSYGVFSLIALKAPTGTAKLSYGHGVSVRKPRACQRSNGCNVA